MGIPCPFSSLYIVLSAQLSRSQYLLFGYWLLERIKCMVFYRDSNFLTLRHYVVQVLTPRHDSNTRCSSHKPKRRCFISHIMAIFIIDLLKVIEI